jgi:hypothetical protein
MVGAKNSSDSNRVGNNAAGSIIPAYMVTDGSELEMIEFRRSAVLAAA